MPNTIQEAIDTLIASLEPSEVAELGRLVPNLRESAARQRMDWIVEIFGLANPDSSLAKDIKQRFPDEEALFKGEVFHNAYGLFEAEIILRELRRTIHSSD